MFGGSGTSPSNNSNDNPASSNSPTETSKSPTVPVPDGDPVGNEKTLEPPESPTARRSDDASPGGDKRNRRQSGIGKARDIFTNAKDRLHLSGSPTRSSPEKIPQTPLQKLSRTDPALNVPQGGFNNAAGETVAGPHASFKVGVTEDKNKKCRRTMEDTHAYLYNFLSTPAPALAAEASSRNRSDTQDSSSSLSSQPVVESDNGYFAIFDGHAGTFAAEWCGKKLHLLLEDTIRKNPNKAIPELLDETFTLVDQHLEKLPLKNSGCTAVIAVLRWEDRIPNNTSATGSTSIAPAAAAAAAREHSNSAPDPPDIAPKPGADAQQPPESKLREVATRQRVLYTANVGDARIVLCRSGKALRLSYDHKGSDDNEGRRIANAGGLILNNRVNGVLAVTRALGDAYMKDLVTGHPYTTETVIQPDIDEFLILACDGLWDVCSDQEAVDMVRNVQDPQAASKVLVDHALSRFSTDNLSCMIARFNNRALQDAVERRSTPIGVEGDPPSFLNMPSKVGEVSEGKTAAGAMRTADTGDLSKEGRKSGSISETEAIVSAARKGMPLANEAEGAGGDLSRISTEMIVEEEQQEPGPELDPEGLTKAKEKAKEGKEKEGEGDESTI